MVIVAVETLVLLFLLWQSAYQKAQIDQLGQRQQELVQALKQLAQPQSEANLTESLALQKQLQERQKIAQVAEVKAPKEIPVVKLSPQKPASKPVKASPAQPAPRQAKTATASERTVFNQLMATCENWRRWYQEDQKDRSLKHRDNACRDAQDYAGEYGLSFKPHATQ